MNKYFKKNDKKVSKLGKYKIPVEWWSRPYEYAFAKNYLVKDERILDVGCGLEHPFKFFASTICDVVALDKDSRILDCKKQVEKIDYVVADILNYKDEMLFDKIFCISVLEHTQSHMIEKMKNIKNLLKEDGRIIITCDSPILKPEKLIQFANSSGLRIDGKNEYEDKKNIIKSDRYNLNCYSMILAK